MEPTLQSLKEQLDRIERMLLTGAHQPSFSPEPMSESKAAFLAGGLPAMMELNKRRGAEARAKKRKAAKEAKRVAHVQA